MTLAGHGGRPRGMFYRPSALPRSGHASTPPTNHVRSVVAIQSLNQVVGVADMEKTSRILKNVSPEHKSWLQREGSNPQPVGYSLRAALPIFEQCVTDPVG